LPHRTLPLGSAGGEEGEEVEGALRLPHGAGHGGGSHINNHGVHDFEEGEMAGEEG